MSFLFAAALALGLFVVLPLAAHLLLRGRAAEQAFPPAALVPAEHTLAKRERRLEDKLLFALRAIGIVLLAILGATPLVQCSRLSLSRGAGGSLALALVVDDSLSMRATSEGGRTRFELAKSAASELLGSTREGDAVSVVLAGKPARTLLGATTDLGLVRRTLDELRPSDRSTDLAGAVALARASLTGGANRERRLVVLSDFASEPLPDGEPKPWAPLPELARALADCGVVTAERRGGRVVASVACSQVEAARGRSVELVALDKTELGPAETERRASIAGPRAVGGTALASVPLAERAGVQDVELVAPKQAPALAVRLSGEDALPRDDAAPVGPDESSLGVGVIADTVASGVATGGPTLVEQALAALEAGISVRPLGVLPDRVSELAAFGLLVLDDPAGMGPEARAALSEWMKSGGVAVALLGPRVEDSEIGSTLEPFAPGAPRWETGAKVPSGADVASLGWLGAEASGLVDMAARGRVVFDVGAIAKAEVLGRFADQAPFIVEQRLGRGRAVSVLLPSSTSVSDFALRPSFIALFDHLVAEAKLYRGLSHTTVGSGWVFREGRPRVVGPEGPVELLDGPEEGRAATPEVAGLYRVVEDGRQEIRVATITAAEILQAPRVPEGARVEPAAAAQAGIDVSNEFSMLLVLVLAAELVLRLLRARAARRT